MLYDILYLPGKDDDGAAVPDEPHGADDEQEQPLRQPGEPLEPVDLGRGGGGRVGRRGGSHPLAIVAPVTEV